MWPTVQGLVDGTPVNADTFNVPIYQLATRTNWLYQQVSGLLASNSGEATVLYDAAVTTSGVYAPIVGDVVYLDPVLGTFSKASASMSFLDVFTASNSAYAIGIVTSISGATGTITTAGLLPLSTAGSGWTLANLIEPNEVFRNGPYYLSSLYPGKLTAYPAGPVVYVGYFISDVNTPTLGDYALLNPQLRDTGESHVHRSFKLYSQPAGQEVIITDGVHVTQYVLGFPTVAVKNSTASAGLWTPTLVCTGTWLAQYSVQYTLWLSNSSSASELQAGSSLPNGTPWGSVYLHWTSSDLTEGGGVVKVWSFESPVAIGTHGMICTLENPNGVTPLEGLDWDKPFYSTVSNYLERSWVVTAPDQTVGWLARHNRQYFVGSESYSLMFIGGPAEYTDGRESDTISVTCAEIHELSDFVNPTDLQTTVIGATTYVYTATAGEAITAGYIPVMIGDTAADTYANLLDAVLEQGVSGITPVVDYTEQVFVVGTPAGTTVKHKGTTCLAVSAGAGQVDGTGTAAAFLIYDQYNQNLVTNYGSAYWGAVTFWTFMSLKNGMQVLITPFSSTGAPAVSTSAVVGDSWTVDFTDQAPSAQFMYAVGMHPALNAYYPPIPAKVAALINNGIELASSLFFTSADYTLGQDTLHWFANMSLVDSTTAAPWPSPFIDYLTPSPGGVQNILLHFVRNTIGDSGYVTSLRAAPGSPISVTQCGTTTPATSGDLQLNLNLTLSAANTGISGYQVAKGVVGSQLELGPVVEKIVAGPGLELTQTGGAPAGQGVVTLQLSSGDSYSGDLEVIALQNAKEEMIGLFPYIRLLGWNSLAVSNTPTGFTAMFRVPHTIVPAAYKVVIYATVFGENSVPLVPDQPPLSAGLTYTYNILPNVYPTSGITPPTNNLITGLIKPDSIKNIAIPFGDPTLVTSPVYTGFDPILVHNNPNEMGGVPNLANQRVQALGLPFPNSDDISGWNPSNGVKPGALIAVQFARANVATPAFEYTGPIGFINLRWMLVSI